VFLRNLKYLLIEIGAIMLLVIVCTLALLVSAALLVRWLDKTDIDRPKIYIIPSEVSSGQRSGS
jgi:hypothetical protein